MRKTLLAVLVLLLLATVAMAQDASYLLKDYMPQTVGSKWVMKTATQQGETTNTITIGEPKDIAGQKVPQVLTTNAQGQFMRGSLEAATENAYTIYGNIRGAGRNQPADTPPTVSLYDPMVVFPAKLTVGQKAEVATKTQMRGQAADVKVSLTLAAVESVTVPKGTFADCLKLVLTTDFGRGSMTRTMWYAKGVGIVKTEQPAGGPNAANAAPRVAELIEYVLAPAQ
jgi:hypothetical protein